MTEPDGMDTCLLQEVVRRIRAVAEPRKIILFGSRAKGQARADSDLDLLIVADTTLPRHRRPLPYYRALAGLGIAKDIVVHTSDEIEE